MRPQKRFLQTKLSRRAALRTALLASPTLAAACILRQSTPATQPSAVTLIPTDKPPETPSAPATIKPPAPTLQSEPTVAPAAVAQALPPTPACSDTDDDPTPSQTEGPYYTPNPPERASFMEPGMAGTRMTVTGLVLTTNCKPVARALLDFWHCDDTGQYDNAGYKLRGHFFSDEAGRWMLETTMPGLYPGRTRHFHVKVQAPNNPILTSQLFFPNEAGNARDGIFDQSLLMEIQDNANGSKTGTFNFVLQVA